MNTSSILLTVLTSSFLSAALTSWINWRIQRNNYKNEYYKKLIEKRIQGYEVIVSICEQLRIIVQHEDGQVVHRMFSTGQEFYTSNFLVIAAAVGNSFWIGEKTSRILTELNIFLLENFTNQLNPNKDMDLQLIRLGVKHKEIISDFRLQLEDSLKSDFKSLHEIDKFINRIDSRKTYLIESKPIS